MRKHIQTKSQNVSARSTQVVNILSGLYFVERELHNLGLNVASNMIEGASLSLREELKRITENKPE